MKIVLIVEDLQEAIDILSATRDYSVELELGVRK